MDERRLTARGLSQRISDNPYLVRDILSGRSQNPRVDTIAKLAEALGVNVTEIMTDQPESDARERGLIGAQIVPKFLAVRFRARAGNWVDVSLDDFQDPTTYAAGPDARFAGFPQWLERIEGDSANLKVPHGHLAHVVDALALGYAPKDGHWVIVERRRNQGRERERSIKQVAIRPDGRVELWPRSSNPVWDKPLRLNHDGPRIVAVGGERPDEEDTEVEIVGLVIGAYDPDFL